MSSPLQTPPAFSDDWECAKCRNISPPQLLYVPAASGPPAYPEQLKCTCTNCSAVHYMACSDAG